MVQIDFGGMGERDILILVAQKCNETTEHLAKLNGTIQDHQNRLTKIETAAKSKWKGMTLVVSFFALVIMELGRFLTWW